VNSRRASGRSGGDFIRIGEESEREEKRKEK
jgi:hypothetical protein